MFLLIANKYQLNCEVKDKLCLRIKSKVCLLLTVQIVLHGQQRNSIDKKHENIRIMRIMQTCSNAADAANKPNINNVYSA